MDTVSATVLAAKEIWGHKAHEWLRAVGVSHYYIARGDRPIEIERADVDMECHTEHGDVFGEMVASLTVRD